ncbi:MAG: hypothetical protein R2781_09000 [Flavobacteriaceae bacterium]
MAGEGSIQGMIVSLRNNKRLLRKKSRFKKNRSFLQKDEMEFHNTAEGIKVEKISKDDLLRIKEKILKERKRYHIRLFIFLFISLPLIIFLLYQAFHDFNFGFRIYNSANSSNIEIVFQKKKEKYLFYLNDGDLWLKKHRYYNAIYQYKKANELFPSEFDAQYRIVLALSYQCQYTFEGCEEGAILVEKLKREFPHSSELDCVAKIFIP